MLDHQHYPLLPPLKVHEDKEVFLASPSFPDGKDISNEVSTGEDITEVPIGNQHDIVEPREDTYLPSKQNVKAPVPRKATPEVPTALAGPESIRWGG